MAKYITVEEALKFVKSGDEIVTGLGASEGRAFLEQLHTISKDIRNVTVVNCLPMTNFEFMSEEHADRFFVDGWKYKSYAATY